MEDVAKIVNSEWDDFITCFEMEYADVGGGGIFYDVTEKACRAWVEHYASKAESYSDLFVPKLVRLHCQDDLDEIEAEMLAEADWLNEAVRDYRSSVGIQFNR
jgi:hypothetical protein